MRYAESREESAELLRMVLPYMARHSAVFSPLSYAVWYEYCGGYNLGLKAAIDELVATGKPLTNPDIELLFDRHIAMRDIEASARMRVKIKDVIERVSEATTKANDEVTLYSKGLSAYQVELLEKPDPEKVVSLVGSLLQETERVRDQTESLRTSLHSSNQEVDRLKEELQVAQGLAQTDPLTGLLNRRGLDGKLAQLSADVQAKCSALFIDIDHFKKVNDTHGHLLGDRVIAVVANTIKNCVADKGLAARMGGEEFAVIVPGQAPATATDLAERIRANVEAGRIRRQDRDEVIGTITVSVGVATPVDGEKVSEAMRRADRALYKSKQDGRNRVTISTRADN
jgi:diguanylate cyclase